MAARFQDLESTRRALKCPQYFPHNNLDSEFWFFPFLPVELRRLIYQFDFDTTECLGILPVKIEEANMDPVTGPDLKLSLVECGRIPSLGFLPARSETHRHRVELPCGLLSASPESRAFVLEKRQNMLPSADPQKPIYYHPEKDAIWITNYQVMKDRFVWVDRMDYGFEQVPAYFERVERLEFLIEPDLYEGLSQVESEFGTCWDNYASALLPLLIAGLCTNLKVVRGHIKYGQLRKLSSWANCLSWKKELYFRKRAEQGIVQMFRYRGYHIESHRACCHPEKSPTKLELSGCRYSSEIVERQSWDSPGRARSRFLFVSGARDGS